MKHRKYDLNASSFSRTRCKQYFRVLRQRTATGNMMGCGLLHLITTYLLAPVLCLCSAINNIHLIILTKIFSSLSLLLYSTARLYSLTNPPYDISLLGELIAMKQLCSWLITKQEPDQSLWNNGSRQLGLSWVCSWMTPSYQTPKINALKFLLIQLNKKGVKRDTFI